MTFTADTAQFRGPIDLLLFLVRRHELELTTITLSKITNQYVEYLDVLKEIEIDMVGDFVEVASLLIEMKAKLVLPTNEIEKEAAEVDPRQDLVQRLLMYKQFKDASLLLEDRANHWQNRFSRIEDDLPPKKTDISDQPIKEIELWDLVSAFGRVLRDNIPKPQENIIYDETPIQVYMKRIHARLVSDRQISFTTLFEPGLHKSAMVGIFLAVLELARHHNVQTRQNELHGEIEIVPGEGFSSDADFSDVDDYEPGKIRSGDPSSLVE